MIGVDPSTAASGAPGGWIAWLGAVARRAASDLARARAFVADHDLLLAAYVVFVCLILVFYDPRIFRPVFYFAVIPCFALSANGWRSWLPVRSTVWWAIAAFSIYVWATWMWGTEPAGTDVLIKEFRRALTIILFVAITTYLAGSGETRLRRLATAIGWFAAATALAAIVRHYWYHPFHARVGGFGDLRNPTQAGGIYVVLLLISYFWGFRGTPERPARLLHTVPCLVLLAFVILTGSRTAHLALIAAILGGAVLRRAWLVVVAIAAPALVYAALLATGVLPMTDYIARADSHRLEIWRHFWVVAQEHLWIGHGAGFDQHTVLLDGTPIVHPHNIYLSALVLGGIPALLLLLAVFAAAFRVAWIEWRANASIGLVVLGIFLFVEGLTNHGVYHAAAGWQWVEIWLPLGFIAARDIAARDGAAATRSSPR